jgi:hypothetical protein
MATRIGQSSNDNNAAVKTNTGRGNGSVTQLMAKSSSGRTVKGGMAGKLKSGTSKTGKQPQPSMNKGPLKPKVIR